MVDVGPNFVIGLAMDETLKYRTNISPSNPMGDAWEAFTDITDVVWVTVSPAGKM